MGDSVMKTIVFILVFSLVRTATVRKEDYYDDIIRLILAPPVNQVPLGISYPPNILPMQASYVYPREEFPDLRDCRPESPCQYGNGDCGEAGDAGCEAVLVCGVNNCGDFVGGMTGSCCAQLASTTYSRELNGESAAPWTSWTATWGGWGRQRVRVLTARDGTRSYQTEKQILD